MAPQSCTICAAEGADGAQGSERLPPAPVNAAPQSRAGRLVSLDAFRGLAILGMLLVNEKAFGPATPAHLTHAGWNEGVHFADMVFPWFLFIVGVAIPFAAAAQRGKGMARHRYYLRIFTRTIALLALGCLINSSYVKHLMFDMGVLQLIGAAYFVGALLYGLPLRLRLAVAAVFLTAHWAMVRFMPIPGVGAGVFTRSQNIIAYLDRTYLERYLLDGVISVVPTSALVLVGTAIGDLLRSESFGERRKIALLAGAGLGLVLAGWLWSFDLPFNKSLWTASYVLFAAGWGTLALGLFHLLIEAKGWRAWAFPLVVAGRNAIFAFAAPILFKLHVLREWHWTLPGGASISLEQALRGAFFSHFGRVPGGFLYTFCYIGAWWLVLLWMYRRRVFLRV